MATGYTKTLVLKTTDGDVTIEGGKAQALQNRLDNDARFIHFTNPDDEHQEDYYNIVSASCGACLFATVTSGTKTVADADCEEALGCDEEESGESGESGYESDATEESVAG